MNDEQIKHMVQRFLTWRLPANFAPDGGIIYCKPGPNYPFSTPSGTNLFDAGQAEAMIRHLVEGLPS